MSDENIDTYSAGVPSRLARFPVVRQLVLLLLFLLILFVIVSGSPQALYNSLTTNSDLSANVGVPVVEMPPGSHTLGVGDESAIKLSARAALVWDVNQGKALFSKNSDEVLPLASITKLMTALVAYELVSGEKVATIPVAATRVQSPTGLKDGEVFSVKALTNLALIASSNDAAFALASAAGAVLGQGAQTEQFIAAMNIRAEEIGLSSLRFYNMTGLDQSATAPGAVGTAQDITLLLEFILKHYPDILPVTTTEALRAYNNAGEFHDVENTNPIISSIPNLLASKTGYTDLAGGNLIVAFDAGFGRPIIITVLGSSKQGRFSDVTTLVDAVTVPIE